MRSAVRRGRPRPGDRPGRARRRRQLRARDAPAEPAARRAASRHDRRQPRRDDRRRDVARSLRRRRRRRPTGASALERADVDLVVVGTRHDTPRRDRRRRAARRQGGLRREAARPDARGDRRRLGGRARATTALAIGFNRPFAAAVAQRSSEELRAAAGPPQLVYRVNAPLPHDHWLNDPRRAAGASSARPATCSTSPTGSAARRMRVLAAALPAPPDVDSPESASITVEYADGSVATVHYSGLGAGAMPKERIEVLRGGRSWVLDDFRALTCLGRRGERTEESAAQDKGHAELLRGVLAACRGEQPFEPGLERRLRRAERRARRARLDRRAVEAVDVPLPEPTDRGWRGEGSLRCDAFDVRSFACQRTTVSAPGARRSGAAALVRPPRGTDAAPAALRARGRPPGHLRVGLGSIRRPGRCRAVASTACSGHSTRSNTTDPSSPRSSPIRRNWCRPAAATTRACISWSRGWPTRSAGRIRSTSCAGWRWSRSVPRSRSIRGSSASYRARSWPRSARPSCCSWGCGSCRWATSTGSRPG